MPNQGMTGWPSSSGGPNLGWGPEPSGMLLPGRVEGWPAGTQRAANDAERLLSQAVGWWDAAFYRDGDRFLRNRGVAGELLDMRLGSSLAANSNDPLWLGPESTGYCYLPGMNGNYLSVPDAAALQIVGDLDIRVQVSLESWSAGVQSFIAKRSSDSEAGMAYHFFNDSSAPQTFVFSWWDTGTGARRQLKANATTGFAAGAVKWVRVTFDVVNAAGTGCDATFYTSDDGATWTRLGDVQTSAGTAAVSAAAGVATEIGSRASGINVMSGRVYRAIVKDGIDGTTVLDVDCDALTDPGATSFTATTGQTVTTNRATSGRKTVAMPARGRGGRAVFLLGTDDFFSTPVSQSVQTLVGRLEAIPISVVYVFRKEVANWNANWRFVNTYHPTSTTPRFWEFRGALGSSTAYFGYTNASGSNSNTSRVAVSTQVMDVAVICAVVDGPNGVARMYSRGSTPVATNLRSLNDLFGTVSSESALIVGGLSWTPNATQDGPFYAAAVFRRALTPAEIATLSNYYSARNY